MRDVLVNQTRNDPGTMYWLRDLAQLSISLVEYRARTATYPNVQQELGDMAQRLQALSQPILISTDESTGLVPVISMLKNRWNELRTRSERPDITGMVGGDELWLPVQQAIALNLAADEILRNSLRHAFPDRAGHVVVTVTYHQDNGMAVIKLSDDGVGAPDATLTTSTNGLGLVRELAGQLSAELAVMSCPKRGTAVKFRFAVRDGRKRPA